MINSINGTMNGMINGFVNENHECSMVLEYLTTFTSNMAQM